MGAINNSDFDQFLKGKHCFVTGGATGIGRAIAEQLILKGAKITIAARNLARLKKTANEIGASYITMDVTKNESVLKAIYQGQAEHGAIDILVNNAGLAKTAIFEKTSDDVWRETFEVNTTGVFLTTKAVLPSMKKNNWGRIINIASTAGLKGYSYVSAYVASKHAVIGLTKSLALELAGKNITANCICPGFTDTEMVARSIETIVEKTGRTKEQALDDLLIANPQKRLIDPLEIAESVLWLCRAESRSVTGQSIIVAGGEIM